MNIENLKKESMEFIKSDNFEKGAEDLKNELRKNLAEGKRVLWFLTGGSSMQACVNAFHELLKSEISLENLTVTITDERYGEVGHADSNWQHFLDFGFDFSKVKNIPVLSDKSEKETTENFKSNLDRAISENEVIIGTFGVGGDVHIAGILPNVVGNVTKDDIVINYKGPDYPRISIGFKTIEKIGQAFVFIFGDNKKIAVEKLKAGGDEIINEPAQILHKLKEVKIYTDQL